MTLEVMRSSSIANAFLDPSQTQTAVISGALQPLQDEFGLTVYQKELVVAGTTLGAIFGGPFAGTVSFIFVCIVTISCRVVLSNNKTYKLSSLISSVAR